MRSGAIDARGITPGRSEVDMQVRGRGIGKEPFDCPFQLMSIHELPIQHHRVLVERANRELAYP